MITTNYSGRTVDLLIFQNTKPAGEQKLHLGFGKAGEVTTGVQKVAQTFTLLLLTEKGSVPSQPTLGSDFLRSVRRQQMRDQSDVRQVFGLAVAAVQRTMAIEATRLALPDDETLDTVELLAVDISAGKLTLTVRLTTEAGAQHDIYLPLSVAIQ